MMSVAASRLPLSRERAETIEGSHGSRAPVGCKRSWPAQRAERKSCFALVRPNDTSGNRKLPYVTHRVLCAMHEATDDSRWELSPSHAAKVAKCCHIDRAKLRNGCVNSS